jgi:Rrf2 family protein
MNFTKTTSYSLQILTFMAEHEKDTISANHLHQDLGIPYSYLRQLLLALAEKGLIKSRKGRNGGFILRKNSAEIYLIEIIEAMEGTGSFDRCMMGISDCHRKEKCALHNIWTSIKTEVLTMLNKTSLADLALKEAY